MFSFNSPIGACPVCEGFGRVIGIDEKLVIPNSALSVYDGAVVCWRGEKMGEWKTEFCRRAQKVNFPIFEPYYKLTREQKDYLWHGTAGASSPDEEVCIDNFFKMLEKDQYKIQNRVMLARYRGKTICPQCHGTRLRPEAGYVKVGGRAISDLVDLPVTELKKFFDTLTLTAHEAEVGKRLLTEINNRIRFLLDVGLEPPEQHAFGRRKPTHQPGHVIGQQPGGFALYLRRTEHRTTQPRHGQTHPCAPAITTIRQHGHRGRT